VGLNRARFRATFPGMDRRPPILDMTLEGEFRTPPRPPLLNRILFWAVITALVCGALVLAAVALWLAMVILPVAIGAAIVAWAIWRYQSWRSGGSIGGRSRDLWRR